MMTFDADDGLKILAFSGVLRLESATTRMGSRPFLLGRRVVREGSSASTVPIPTITAETRSLSRWTFARDSSEEIHCECPVRVAIRPSRLMANLRKTKRPAETDVGEVYLDK